MSRGISLPHPLLLPTLPSFLPSWPPQQLRLQEGGYVHYLIGYSFRGLENSSIYYKEAALPSILLHPSGKDDMMLSVQEFSHLHRHMLQSLLTENI